MNGVRDSLRRAQGHLGTAVDAVLRLNPGQSAPTRSAVPRRTAESRRSFQARSSQQPTLSGIPTRNPDSPTRHDPEAASDAQTGPASPDQGRHVTAQYGPYRRERHHVAEHGPAGTAVSDSGPWSERMAELDQPAAARTTAVGCGGKPGSRDARGGARTRQALTLTVIPAPATRGVSQGQVPLTTGFQRLASRYDHPDPDHSAGT